MKVFHLAHNHPDFHAGGTEIIAHALAATQNAWDDWQARFIGAALAHYRKPHAGTPFSADNEESGDIIIAAGSFKSFHLSQFDTLGVLQGLGELFQAEQPDVVHFHHFLLLGLESLVIARRQLPHAAIIVTLHDYYPICHHDGLMITTGEDRLCERATPARCAQCFPEWGAMNFRLRERFVKNALALADVFVAPSRFLAQRYIDWGLPAERVQHIPNGYPAPAGGRAADTSTGIKRGSVRRSVEPSAPVRFGFFGHFNEAKGIRVLLEAACLLQAEGQTGFRVVLHGSDQYAPESLKSRLFELLETLGELAQVHGAYDRHAVSSLMAAVDWVVMPSIWWENDPLVISEAFLNRRPVICSGIGGMAERVTPEVHGLHVPPNDPPALAAAMQRVLAEPKLARKLTRRLPPVPDMQTCAEAYRALYQAARAPANASSACV